MFPNFGPQLFQLAMFQRAKEANRQLEEIRKQLAALQPPAPPPESKPKPEPEPAPPLPSYSKTPLGRSLENLPPTVRENILKWERQEKVEARQRQERVERSAREGAERYERDRCRNERIETPLWIPVSFAFVGAGVVLGIIFALASR